jgi:hypothetical protein
MFSGCSFQKHYIRNDYSFYSKEFRLDNDSPLRTDGVYIVDKIETDAVSEFRKMPKERKVYKFYPTGQVNMVLDPNNELKSDDDYMKGFNRRISDTSMSKRATLFEGYYRIRDNKIVIQFIHQPFRQFYYTYAYLTEQQFIIVRTTHLGKGKMKDKYYTSYYKEFYHFQQKPVNGYLLPDW